VLVNNAGITGPVRDDPHDYTAGDMTEVLLTNVVGCLRVIHAFLPLLEKSGGPRIVNVSSDLGSFRCFHDRSRTGAFAGTPIYAASQAAISMMTVQFASLLPDIRINAINPGLTATGPQRRTGPFGP
jgi:NAD(P)-dependent dehydrogenase (short-subunit alcohol dehydrogenase family)